MTEENVLEALKNVTYPGFTKDIVTFGFVKDVLVNGTTIGLTIDITSSADEVKAQLRDEATKELQKLGFENIKGIKLFTEPDWCKSNYWMAIIQVPANKRDEFIAFMESKYIESRPLWELNNRHPMYSACSCANIDNSIDLYESVVAIPCNQAMSEDDAQRVIDAVIEFTQIEQPKVEVEENMVEETALV